MECHGGTYDICNLDEVLVVELFHGMQNTPLHRFQTVVDMRYRTVENGIRSIVKIPALEHAAQLMAHHVIAQIDQHGFETAFGGFAVILFVVGTDSVYFFFVVVVFVAHVI